MLVFLCVLLVSCREEGCEKGEGASHKRVFTFGHLSAINLNMVSDMVVTEDSFRTGVTVEAVAQNEMHKILLFDSANRELTVRLTDCIREHNPVLIDARFSELPKEMVVNSAGSIESGELLEIDSLTLKNQGLGDIDLLVKSKNVDVRVEESGNVLLGGEADRLSVWCVSSGDIRAYNLVADTVEVEYIGTNFIEVHAKDVLIVDFRIPGTVHYRGNPTIIVEGNGDLIDRNL